MFVTESNPLKILLLPDTTGIREIVLEALTFDIPSNKSQSRTFAA